MTAKFREQLREFEGERNTLERIRNASELMEKKQQEAKSHRSR